MIDASRVAVPLQINAKSEFRRVLWASCEIVIPLISP